MKTYREAYEEGRKLLAKAGILEADLDARLLLEYVCNTNRNDLLLHGDKLLEEQEKTQYLALIKRRSERVPLQHLTGEQMFMGLPFFVNENVLIPRQDTECLVELILQDLAPKSRVLDICTGSGCILLSILSIGNLQGKDCQGVGSDISPKALEVAKKNASRLNVAASFFQGDLLESVTGTYDVIVSNPPYIESEEIEALMPEVRNHEPVLALDGGADGLDFYKRLVKESIPYCNPGGRLYFEIGYNQGEAVKLLMEEAGYQAVTVAKDYAGLDRVVYGIWSGK